MDLDKNPELSFCPPGHKYRPPRINDDLFQAKVPLWYSSSSSSLSHASGGGKEKQDSNNDGNSLISAGRIGNNTNSSSSTKEDAMVIDDTKDSSTTLVTPKHNPVGSKTTTTTTGGPAASVTNNSAAIVATTTGSKRYRAVPAPLARLRDAYNDIKVPSALYGNQVQPSYTTSTVYSVQELQENNLTENDINNYLFFVKYFIHGYVPPSFSSRSTTITSSALPSTLATTLSSYSVPTAFGINTGFPYEPDSSDYIAFSFLRKYKYNIDRAKFLLVAFLGSGKEHSALLRLNDISQGQFKFQHPEYVSEDEEEEGDEDMAAKNGSGKGITNAQQGNGGSFLTTSNNASLPSVVQSSSSSSISAMSLTNGPNNITVASSTSTVSTTTTAGVRGGGDGLMDKGNQDDRGIKETPLGLGLDTGLIDVFNTCDTATTVLASNHNDNNNLSSTLSSTTIITDKSSSGKTNSQTFTTINQWKIWLTNVTNVLNSRTPIAWNKYIQLRSEALDLYRVTKNTNNAPEIIDPEILSIATKLGYRIRAIVRWRARIRDSLCDVLRLRGALPLWRFEWLVAEVDNYKVELVEYPIVQSIAKEGRTWMREAEEVLSRINASTKAVCAAELLFYEDDALAGPSGESDRTVVVNTSAGDDVPLTGSTEKTEEKKPKGRSSGRSAGNSMVTPKPTENKESADTKSSAATTTGNRASATALVFTTRLTALTTAQQHAPPVSILDVSKLLQTADSIPLGLAPLYQDLKLHLDRAVALAQKVIEHFPYYLSHPKTIPGNRTSQGYGLSRDLVGSKGISTINFIDTSNRNSEMSLDDGNSGKTSAYAADTIENNSNNNNNATNGTGSMADGSSPYFPYATYYDMPLSSNISAINGTARRMRIPFTHIDSLARDIRECGISFYEGELLKIYHNEALSWLARSHELVSVKNRASIQSLRELLAEADYIPIDLSERVAVLRYEIDRGTKWVDSVRVLLPKGAQRTRGGMESSKGATLPQILQKVEQVREGLVAAPMEDAEEAATLVQTVQEWINDVRYALEGSRSLKSLTNSNAKNNALSNALEENINEGDNEDKQDQSDNKISLEFLSSLLRQADNIPIMMDEYTLLQAEVAARKWAMKAQKLLNIGSRLETLREHIKEIRDIRSKVPDAGMPPLGFDGQMIRVDEEILINRLIRNAEDWLTKSKSISTTAKGKHRVSINRIRLLIDEGKALPVNMAVYIRPFEGILTAAEKWSTEATPILELVRKHKEKHKLIQNFMQQSYERVNIDNQRKFEQQLEEYRQLPTIPIVELQELVQQSLDLNCIPEHEDELKIILKHGEQWIQQVQNLLPSLVPLDDIIMEEIDKTTKNSKGGKSVPINKSTSKGTDNLSSSDSTGNGETPSLPPASVVPIEDVREILRQGISLNIKIDEYLQPILLEFQKVREWQIRARTICNNLGIINSPVLSTDAILDRILQILGYIDTNSIWTYNDESTGNNESTSVSYTIDDALRMLEQIVRNTDPFPFSTPEQPILHRNLIVLRWIVIANRTVNFMDRYRDRIHALIRTATGIAGKNTYTETVVSTDEENDANVMYKYPPLSKLNVNSIPIGKYYQDISWENFLYRRLTEKAAEYGASYWIGNLLENDEEIDKVLKDVFKQSLDFTNDPDLQPFENKQKENVEDSKDHDFITETIPGKRSRTYRTLHTLDGSTLDNGSSAAITSQTVGSDVTAFAPTSDTLSIFETGELSIHHRPSLSLVRELVKIAVDIGVQLIPSLPSNASKIETHLIASTVTTSRSPVVARSSRKHRKVRENENTNDGNEEMGTNAADTNVAMDEGIVDYNPNDESSTGITTFVANSASSDVFSSYINSLSVKIKGLSNENCSVLYSRVHDELLNIDRWIREYQSSFSAGVTNLETALKLFSRGIQFSTTLPDVQRLWKYIYQGHSIFNQLMGSLPSISLGKLSPSPSMLASITYGIHPNPEGKSNKSKNDNSTNPESNYLTNEIWRARYGPHLVRQQNKSSRLRIRATRIFVNKKGEIVVRDGKMAPSSSGSNVLSSSNNDDEEILETPLPLDQNTVPDDEGENTSDSSNKDGDDILRPTFKSLERLVVIAQNSRIRLPIVRDIRGILRIGHKWLEEVHHAGFEEGIATNDTLKMLLDSAEFVWVDISDVTDSIALASASTCVCDQPYAHPMVECPSCTRLYHYDCVGFKLSGKSLRIDISQFRCPQCSAQEAISNQLYLCYQSLIRVYWGAQATWSAMPHPVRHDSTVENDSVPLFPLRQLERAAQEAQQLQVYSFHSNNMIIPFMNLAAQYFNTKPLPLREITQIIEPIASLRRIYSTDCMQWLDQIAEVYFPANVMDGERYRTVAHIRTLIQNSLSNPWSMHAEINSLRNGLKILLWSQTCIPYMSKIFSLSNLEFILSSARATGLPEVSPLLQYLALTYSRAHSWKHITYNLLSAKGPLSDTLLNDYNDHLKLSRFIPADLSIDESRLEAVIVDGGKAWCLCGGLADGFMISCDACEEWYHGKCVGIQRESDIPSSYQCPECCRLNDQQPYPYRLEIGSATGIPSTLVSPASFPDRSTIMLRNLLNYTTVDFSSSNHHFSNNNNHAAGTGGRHSSTSSFQSSTVHSQSSATQSGRGSGTVSSTTTTGTTHMNIHSPGITALENTPHPSSSSQPKPRGRKPQSMTTPSTTTVEPSVTDEVQQEVTSSGNKRNRRKDSTTVTTVTPSVVSTPGNDIEPPSIPTSSISSTTAASTGTRKRARRTTEPPGTEE